MIWNPEAECFPPEQRKKIQLAYLKNLVERVYERVPFYRKKFQEAGITPQDIRNLEDIQKIPFTTKDDLRETYPYGLLAVPAAEIDEIHMSSGTTGTP
ncbi:MAG TPA: phenylacetate--CoA ligase, partial [Spirochaetales bacterium]|nr:phenylacetate--CoA ligase [Spirochaetales bacterium]